MANLKDRIQREIREKRERSLQPAQTEQRSAGGDQLDDIRPRLDELAHVDEKYSLKVEYAVGPYAADIAIVELYDPKGVWVASWQVAKSAGGSAKEWEVTYNPYGVDTHHKWFRNTDGLFDYLAESIADRIFEMDAGG